MSINTFEEADRVLKLRMEKKIEDRLREQKEKRQDMQERFTFAKSIFEWVNNFVKSDFFKTVFSDPRRKSVDIYRSHKYHWYQVTRDGKLQSYNPNTCAVYFLSSVALADHESQCQLSPLHYHLISGRALQSIVQQASS